MGRPAVEGRLWGPGSAKERKSPAGFWERAGEGRGGRPAWRRFRSPGSERQAVLGSGLEPLIWQRRVTWMPGIPEPGLFRCAPPRRRRRRRRSLPRPARPHCGRREDTGTKGLGRAGGASLSQGERPPAPSTARSPLAPRPVSRIRGHPGLGAPPPPALCPPDRPRVLSWWLGMAKGSGFPAPARALEVWEVAGSFWKPKAGSWGSSPRADGSQAALPCSQ